MRPLGLSLLLLLPLASAPLALAEPPPVELQDAYPNLAILAPSDIQDPGDGSGRLFAVEVPGRIIGFENDAEVSEGTVFLDLSSTVSGRGMNGLAFHPDHADNGFVYVSYTIEGPYRSVVSRFSVFADDPDRVDVDSEQILLEVPEQGGVIHVVHRLVFGPDGYLYIGSGDNLPRTTAQDLSDWNGKVLRIDVDHPSDTRPYGIPPDNPFAGNAQGHLEEIYAYGFRNPWEFSFDPSGRLWLGDVGESAREEIDLVVAGGNHGWPIFEGKRCNRSQTICDAADTVFPVWDYPHTNDEQGGRSVIGGEVYQGASCPAVRGKYVFADFSSRNVWALTVDALGNASHEVLVVEGPAFYSATGLDAAGELLIIAWNSGQIFKLHCPAIPVEVAVAPGRRAAGERSS
jgi:glucose/arabinose dehydrogenase